MHFRYLSYLRLESGAQLIGKAQRAWLSLRNGYDCSLITLLDSIMHQKPLI
jgi:uncharacterized protein YecT (DUF1311 family)